MICNCALAGTVACTRCPNRGFIPSITPIISILDSIEGFQLLRNR